MCIVGSHHGQKVERGYYKRTKNCKENESRDHSAYEFPPTDVIAIAIRLHEAIPYSELSHESLDEVERTHDDTSTSMHSVSLVQMACF